MPLQLRDNLGNRLVLRVESPCTSKLALGEEGSERLLGKGHLAARLPSEDRVILAQVPILAPEQIRAIVAAVGQELGSFSELIHVGGEVRLRHFVAKFEYTPDRCLFSPSLANPEKQRKRGGKFQARGRTACKNGAKSWRFRQPV